MSKKLQEELKEKLDTKKLERCDVSTSGGCINKGLCYRIDNDDSIFVKTNATIHAATMFDGEFESLKQINLTNTIRGPKPLTVIHNFDETQGSAIAMEYLEIVHLTDDGARKLGENLAHLHDYNNKVQRFNERASGWIGGKPSSTGAVSLEPEEDSDDRQDEQENQFTKHRMQVTGNDPASNSDELMEYPARFVPKPGTEEIVKFGFDLPTSCGLIPQINEWTDDWVSFYARHRLDKSIRALLSDHGDRELSQQWSHLQLKINKFFSDFDSRGPNKIVPALLHGDLWSGNVAQFRDSYQAVIYDPSSFYGHSEYDFGIARMFGGIPKAFEESYFEILPKRKKLFEKRNKLYQLFHHLNHWDHFGSGYRSGSLRIMKDLNEMV